MSERSASASASSRSATAVETLESLYRHTPSRKTISARSTSEKTDPSATARALFSSSIAVRRSPSCIRAQASPERVRTSSSTEFVAETAARASSKASIDSL